MFFLERGRRWILVDLTKYPCFLRDADEFLSMGFDEYFYAGGICCIEWSEKIAELIPEEAITIELTHLGENKRSVNIVKKCERG